MNAASIGRIGLAVLAIALIAALGACGDPKPTLTPTAPPTATTAPVSMSPPVGFVVIEPAQVTLQLGQTQEFRVAAFDQFEKPIPQWQVALEFEITEGTGQVSGSGRFVATHPGTVTVRVKAEHLGTRSATAVVTVVPAPTPTPRPTATPAPTATPTPFPVVAAAVEPVDTDPPISASIVAVECGEGLRVDIRIRISGEAPILSYRLWSTHASSVRVERTFSAPFPTTIEADESFIDILDPFDRNHQVGLRVETEGGSILTYAFEPNNRCPGHSEVG